MKKEKKKKNLRKIKHKISSNFPSKKKQNSNLSIGHECRLNSIIPDWYAWWHKVYVNSLCLIEKSKN